MQKEKPISFDDLRVDERYYILTGIFVNPISFTTITKIKKDLAYGRRCITDCPEPVKRRDNLWPMFFDSEYEARLELKDQLETMLNAQIIEIKKHEEWEVLRERNKNYSDYLAARYEPQ